MLTWTAEAALRYHLGQGFQYDFVEGSHPWPAAKGIKEAFGAHQVCYSYLDGTPSSAVEAIDKLGSYVRENGPFDVAMGFSLGAALIATLLLQPDDWLKGYIRTAVFVCGIRPGNLAVPEEGPIAFMDSSGIGRAITIPTLHSWSPEDAEFPGHSEKLMQICAAKSLVEIRHSAGHGIPSRGDEVVALATTIRDMLAGLQA